jgi:nucleoside-diphosphate-sugar epimerase
LLKVILTGASGLIGGEVAFRLAARGHRVTALVHRNRTIRDHRRTPAAVAEIVVGNVAAPRLGLDGEAYARLAARHDLVIHCAAATRFDEPDGHHTAANIDGTANVVALARSGAMALLHVSTAYVCGRRDGLIREADPLPEAGFSNRYEATKAAAERLVAHSGLTHAIVRPSIVVGHSETGAIGDFRGIYGIFRLIAQGRVTRMPARRGAALDLVPINHVAAGIIAVAENIRSASGAYHLVSASPVPVEDAVAAIARHLELRGPELVEPSIFDPASLTLLERWLHAQVVDRYSAYLQRAPRFDDSRIRALTRLTCPATDRAFLERLTDHCLRAGFVSRRSLSEHAGSVFPGACELRMPTSSQP